MNVEITQEPGETIPLTPVLSANMVDTVMAYLGRLGLTDVALMRQVAEECLERARRRAAPGSESELLRRSLEEAQRRFNHALGTALDIRQGHDERSLAAARAAFLLRSDALPADELFRSPDGPHDWAEALSRALPQSTPPEAPLEMHQHPLRFWLFRS